MYPLLQKQIGLWLMTLQLAFKPHELGHGSVHFWFTQARLAGHSVLTTHSGRQLGGEPTNVERQEQIAMPLFTRHSLLGPQGDGLHGSTLSGSSSSLKNYKYFINVMRIQYLRDLSRKIKILSYEVVGLCNGWKDFLYILEYTYTGVSDLRLGIMHFDRSFRDKGPYTCFACKLS